MHNAQRYGQLGGEFYDRLFALADEHYMDAYHVVYLVLNDPTHGELVEDAVDLFIDFRGICDYYQINRVLDELADADLSN